MKITILKTRSNRKECINKDFMGGYGWAFNAGSSLPARLINYVKKQGESLPIFSYAYMASIFESNGHQVEYVDNKMPSSDLVIMQSSMVDYKNDIEWSKKIKQSGIKVGFIGPFSGAMPELFLPYADFVIKGEPEDAAIRLSRGLQPEGLIESKGIEDLDKLPFPSWDKFEYKKFSYVPAIRERPFFPVLSSRGCPFTCNYCPYLVDYKWRQRQAANVLEEISYLKKRYNLKAMLFRDPIFTFDRARAMAISEGIIKSGFRIKWACETRIDKLDKGLLDTMYRAGLRVINVGVESYNEDVVRKASRKPINISHQEEIIEYCERLGIRVTVFYMLGMPDDTRGTILDTINYAKKLNTHVAQFFIFTPFPGTEYYENIKNEIYEKDWEKFDCYTPVFRHKNISQKELIMYKEKAFVGYYYRPAWFFKLLKRTLRDILDK